MGATASQITSLTIVYSIVYLGADKKNQSSLHPRIPPARPRDLVIQIKPQAPKVPGLIRIQVLVSSQKQGTIPQPRATA